MSKMFFELSMLAFEAQQAMWLRTVKLCSGGAEADREAKLMVDEKVSAAMQAAGKLMSGAHPGAVVKAYGAKCAPMCAAYPSGSGPNLRRGRYCRRRFSL